MHPMIDRLKFVRRHLVITALALALLTAGLLLAQLADAEPAPPPAASVAALKAPYQKSAPAPAAVRASYAVLEAVGERRMKQAVGEKAWTESTAKGACIWFLPPGALGPGGSCFDEATLLRGTAWTVGGNRATGYDFQALLPNGASTAVVSFADGTSKEVPVVNNTINLVSKVNIAGYRYKAQGVERRVTASGLDE